MFVCKKKSYKIYRSFKRSYIETYFTIIEICISIIRNNSRHIFLCWIFLFYICVRFCQINFFPRCGWFFLWSFSLFMFFSFWYFVFIYFIQFWKWIFIAFLLYCNACRMKLETIFSVEFFISNLKWFWCRSKSTFRLREEFIYSSLVKQILLCPSLPCNQIFILLCKLLVATEISVLVAHWLPWTILFRYSCLHAWNKEWWLSFNWSS